MGFKTNFNEYVKVKLTDEGITILRHERDELNKSLQKRGVKGFGEYIPKTDEDGYSTFQIWQLMQVFGPHIAMGYPEPFEDTGRRRIDMNPNEYTIYEWVNGTYLYYINIGQVLIGYDDPPNFHVIDGVMFDDVKDELNPIVTRVLTHMESARLMVQLIRTERTPLSLYYAKALLLEAGMSYNYITPNINGVNEQELQDVRLMQLAHVDPTKVMVYLIPISSEYP